MGYNAALIWIDDWSLIIVNPWFVMISKMGRIPMFGWCVLRVVFCPWLENVDINRNNYRHTSIVTFIRHHKPPIVLNQFGGYGLNNVFHNHVEPLFTPYQLL